MRRPLTASLIACTFALAAPAAAEETVVPVEKAPYHRPVFHNDLVMLLSVYLPPGAPRGPEVYHTHSLDQVSVLVEATDMANKALGDTAMGRPRHGQRGNVGYTAFSKKPETHWGANVGTTPFLNIVTALLYPQGGRFTAGSRTEVHAYQQLIDNDRVRAWRLTLEPGQAAGAITQRAPGMRIVVDGGEISESVPGAADRAWGLRSGEFFWQDPGVTRAVKNTGTSPINIVEFELK
ncbi:MAG TPA: hypothetical protein VH684_21770 [Xanthobacteraceae bacterium]